MIEEIIRDSVYGFSCLWWETLEIKSGNNILNFWCKSICERYKILKKFDKDIISPTLNLFPTYINKNKEIVDVDFVWSGDLGCFLSQRWKLGGNNNTGNIDCGNYIFWYDGQFYIKENNSLEYIGEDIEIKNNFKREEKLSRAIFYSNSWCFKNLMI